MIQIEEIRLKQLFEAEEAFKALLRIYKKEFNNECEAVLKEQNTNINDHHEVYREVFETWILKHPELSEILDVNVNRAGYLIGYTRSMKQYVF